MNGPLIGFIGLGNMGAPMASNLLRAGYRLLVCDKSPTAVSSLVSAGATSASSPVDISTSAGVQAIVTMLPSHAALNDVYCGQYGLLSAGAEMRAPLFIDSSTAAPSLAAELAQRVAESALHPTAAAPDLRILHKADSSFSNQPPGDQSAGTQASSPPPPAHSPSAAINHGLPRFVDAPVSGGVAGAQAATLTFMAGGELAAVAAATPLLLSMGKKVVHCGFAGAGQAAKLCNNLVLAICMGAVSEGMALGKGLGLDPVVLANVFNTSSARCWAGDTYNPCPGVMPNVPSSNEYKPGFQAALMVKDLLLALEAGAEQGAATPLGNTALELFRTVASHQGGTPPLDFSAVYKVVYEAALSRRGREP